MTIHSRPARTSGLETKFVSLDAFHRNDVGDRVAGYASLFGRRDQGGDTVMPGAFAVSLARLEAAGQNVKFLWQHDPARPIGVWSSVREDETGLRVEGQILSDLAQGAEALSLMRAGAVDGLSIGYRTIRAEPDRESGGRRLHEVDLWEVSLVTFPMLPTARASLTRAGAEDAVATALAEALTSAGQPAE